MKIELVTVSKLSSEILDTAVVNIEHTDFPQLSDLMNIIYDKYSELWYTGNYKLFWEYRENVFFQIKDYISYLTAIRLMTNKKIYVLIDDYVDYWEDNVSFLAEMDRIEEEERKERERNIYDVKIIRKIELESNDEDKSTTLLKSSTLTTVDKTIKTSSIIVERTPRTETDILSYAIKRLPKPNCYTQDMVQKYTLMEDLQKGFPKFRTELQPLPNYVFEKRVFKPTKGGKDKNGKEKKDGKKDKKAKADKKKGGKKKK